MSGRRPDSSWQKTISAFWLIPKTSSSWESKPRPIVVSSPSSCTVSSRTTGLSSRPKHLRRTTEGVQTGTCLRQHASQGQVVDHIWSLVELPALLDGVHRKDLWRYHAQNVKRA